MLCITLASHGEQLLLLILRTSLKALGWREKVHTVCHAQIKITLRYHFFSPHCTVCTLRIEGVLLAGKKAALLRHIKDALASLHFVHLNKPLWHRDAMKTILMALTVRKHLVCCKQMGVAAAQPPRKDLSSEQHALGHSSGCHYTVFQKKTKVNSTLGDK